MTQIQRARVVWNGTPVTGGGISNFYCATTGDPLITGLKGFFNDLVNVFPSGLTWTVPDGGDLVEDTTGQLAGTWDEGAGAGGTVTATNSGTWVQGVGARVVWNTGGMTNGRRVRGSTFLVPLVINGYEGAGAITSAYLTAMSNAAQGLLDMVPTLRVLSPPLTPGGSTGKSSVITTFTVPDRVSWLRSRRT